MSDEYTTMQDASAKCGIPVRTLYRLARDLGVARVKYGRHLVPTAKLGLLKRSRRGRGNPEWIANPAAAAAASVLAAKSRAQNRRAKK